MRNQILNLFLMSTAFMFLTGFKPFVSQPHLQHQSKIENTDKTLSPYFFVKSDDPKLDQLPLKSTSVLVNIAGVIADVAVTQEYKNQGKRPIEAIYIFPASTRAAVYGMKMTIGKRTIVAKIKEREQARKDYEDAKKAGKSASLLEQQRPNVFQMNVANILPGDNIKVELKYTELIIPTAGIYEFIYPAVAGPRYSNLKPSDAPSSEQWVKNPYLHAGEKPTYTFDIKANISGGLPISEVSCTSHKANITYDGKKDAIIELDPEDRFGGNRDFIVKYRLSGSKIESGLLLYQRKDENFFLAMIQPPKRVPSKDIPPREYIFVVDVSGSMRGFPLDISKKLLKDLISNLKPTDVFNVLLFAGGSSVMSEKSIPANKENLGKAINLIQRQRGGGGTELLPALEHAFSIPKTSGFSKTVVIVTDGYVRVEEEAFDLIRKNLGHANMFAFGIGSSVNRFIIEGMARVGMGEPFVVTKPDNARSIAAKFRKLIESPILTNIKMNFKKFKTYDVEPISIPDLMADRPVLIFGKWKGKSRGMIILQGTLGKKSYASTIDVNSFKPADKNSAIRYLWARHKIALLSDYNMLSKNDERVRQVTDLGLAYNLLTTYTSFVAIDTKIRLKDGKTVTVKQPLPLPQGVSDYAVGGQRVMGLGGYSLGKAEASVKGLEEVRTRPRSAPAKKVKLAHVNIKDLKIQGNHANLHSKKIRERIDKIERCIGEKFAKPFYVEGEIGLYFTIDKHGEVKNLKIAKDSLNNEKAKECIIYHLKGIKFTKSKDGKDVRVELILKLHAR